MSAWKTKTSPRSALVFAVAAVGLGASLWSCGRTPPEAKGPQPAESGPPASVSQAVAEAAPPQPAPSPTEEPGASTAERWQALGVGSGPSQAPATTMTAAGGFPTLPPPTTLGDPPPEPTPAGPSETELLQEKIQRYRAEYGPAKTRVASLEREVADLAELATKVYAEGNSAAATLDADIVRARLNKARQDLETAKEAVAAIEERARRDGVSYGQLY
jgi:hypothetical protein